MGGAELIPVNMIYAALGNSVFSFETKNIQLGVNPILTWLSLNLLVTVAIGKHSSRRPPTMKSNRANHLACYESLEAGLPSKGTILTKRCSNEITITANKQRKVMVHCVKGIPTFLFTEKIAASWKASTTNSKSSSDVAMVFSTLNICSSAFISTCLATVYSLPPPYMPESRQFPESPNLFPAPPEEK